MKTILTTLVCSTLFAALLPAEAEDPTTPFLTVKPAQVVEGDGFPGNANGQITIGGFKTLDFVFELSQPVAVPVTGTYSVVPGAPIIVIGPNPDPGLYPPATSGSSFVFGSDFTAVSGVPFTIPAGSTSITVKVNVFPDYVDEPDEYLHLRIDSLSGIPAAILPNFAQGTIIDNDAPLPATLPSLRIKDVQVFEGSNVPSVLTFVNLVYKVELSAPSPAAVMGTFSAAPLSGSGFSPAEAGVDFQPSTNAFFGIPPNAISGTISVRVLLDSLVEPDEHVLLTLANVTGAKVLDGTATGTIRNDDGPPRITINNVSVVEPKDVPSVTTKFTVSLSHPNYTLDTQVQFATRNGMATASTATVPGDYLAKQGTLTIPASALSGTIPVTILKDQTISGILESNETFFIDLRNPINGVVSDGVGGGNIVEKPPELVTGVFDVTWDGDRAEVDEIQYFTIVWTVPDGKVWRDLESIDLRLRDGNGPAFWARWDEATDTFVLVEKGGQPRKKHGNGRKSYNGPSTGDPTGDPAAPGSDIVLESREARLHLEGTSVEGSGPTGTTVTLDLAVSFPKKAAGRAYLIELAATDDTGSEDAFVQSGTISIQPRR